MVGPMPRSNVYLLTDYRTQVYRDDEPSWAPVAPQPLLPDRDAITSNAWIEVYSLSPTSSLEDEEGETTGSWCVFLASCRMS